MKKIFSTIFICICSVSLYAQIPTGYYTSALGKTGTALRTSLHNIIKGHTAISYSELLTAYQSTDKKSNGKVWDIYSDKPGASAPYEYSFTDNGASAGSEGQGWNREHTWPQSLFSSNPPMQSDLFIVYPTDIYVNSKRNNFPYGKVGSASWTSMNGSKLGNNTYAGASTGTCFEPIDSFKGDIARTYFYIATRYYSEDGGWDNWDMSNGAELKPWAILMLLEWHHLDPVSQKEIDRNNAVYDIQHNRNPFIDYPEMADCIFGTEDCTYLATGNIALHQQISIFPNPANEELNILYNGDAPIKALEITDISGKKIISLKQDIKQVAKLNIADLPNGIYILNVLTDNATAHLKFVK